MLLSVPGTASGERAFLAAYRRVRYCFGANCSVMDPSRLPKNRRLTEDGLKARSRPMEFLVAAHIKKRSLCSDDERRDLQHVAMLACTFGCDSLYESGWISVDQTGFLQTVPLEQAPAGRLREHLDGLAGLRCGAYGELSEAYFAWHRSTMFRGASIREAPPVSGSADA